MIKFLPDNIIDILRHIRDFMEFFGTLNISGFPLDWLFHLIVTFLLMFTFSRFLSLKKSILLISIFIFGKEIADIFVKSRPDYIVPLQIDTIKDILAGFLGIYLSIKAKMFKHAKSGQSTDEKN